MDVCLVNMPWAYIDMPLVSLSVLKATLREKNISCYVDYANIYFAATCDFEKYYTFERSYQAHLIGEFIFADAMGMPRAKSAEEYVAWFEEDVKNILQVEYEVKQLRSADIPANLTALKNNLAKMQRLAEKSIAETADRILAKQPRIVGLASMFQQNNAAIALLRHLKAKDPNLITIMGGANCMQDAGRAMVDQIPELDFTFSGEADECFAEFCQELLADGLQVAAAKIPYGVMRKNDGGKVPYRISENINQLPLPDYEDYFAALEATGLDKKIKPVLMIEGSRGCWWAKQKPCTFCGLNGQVHNYRQKDTPKLLQEIIQQAEKYSLNRFFFTDSILSMQHVIELPKLLQALPNKYTFCSEIKSNITKNQLKQLHQAGFFFLQPGIESLQDEVLQLMNKGNRAIKHIELLKNLRQYGIKVAWNLLSGFPGEKAAWYEEILALLPKITHLPAPNGVNHIMYHRNNEYQLNAAKYQLTLKPATVYSYVWPQAAGFIERVGYLFEPQGAGELKYYYHHYKKDDLFYRLNLTVEAWKQGFAQNPDRLDLHVYDDRIEIYDLRRQAKEYHHVFSGIYKTVYLLCDQAIEETKILAAFPAEYKQADVINVLAEFCREDLMLKIGNEYLALAIQDPD